MSENKKLALVLFVLVPILSFFILHIIDAERDYNRCEKLRLFYGEHTEYTTFSGCSVEVAGKMISLEILLTE